MTPSHEIIDHHYFNYLDFECRVTKISRFDPFTGRFRSWRNGYVAIPEGHCLYEIHYHDQPNWNVHGGLTYSQYENNFSESSEKNEYRKWVIGFDTNHFQDQELERTHDYVVEEIKRLVDQIVKLTPSMERVLYVCSGKECGNTKIIVQDKAFYFEEETFCHACFGGMERKETKQ